MPSIFVLLTVLFVALKLCNVIFWSWVWVLSPIWLPVVLICGFYGLCFILYYITNREDKQWRK